MSHHSPPKDRAGLGRSANSNCLQNSQAYPPPHADIMAIDIQIVTMIELGVSTFPCLTAFLTRESRRATDEDLDQLQPQVQTSEYGVGISHCETCAFLSPHTWYVRVSGTTPTLAHIGLLTERGSSHICTG